MWRVNLKNIGATLKFIGAKTAHKISALSQMAPFLNFFLYLALLILFFVTFLFTPLSALLRDFVSYSRVVTCNYVITGTSSYCVILFKALFYSKEPKKVSDRNVFIKFFIFFTSEVVHPRIFLTLYVRVCCEFWTANLFWSSWRSAPLLAWEI